MTKDRWKYAVKALRGVEVNFTRDRAPGDLTVVISDKVLIEFLRRLGERETIDTITIEVTLNAAIKDTLFEWSIANAADRDALGPRLYLAAAALRAAASRLELAITEDVIERFEQIGESRSALTK